MDLKDHLLQTKRFFEEQEKKYKGPDPLGIRCEFINILEKYDKTQIEDIYCPFLEETLKQFKDNPNYKQDLRFIQLWLNYSSTQANPIEVMERMHSRGLGTECAVLYSTWAHLLMKQGSITNADSVFKIGLSNHAKPKSDLEKDYDEFLKDIGRKFLMGKITCPKCGSAYKHNGTVSGEETGTAPNADVEVWEWNPLKVGDPDDFKCPLAYFEDPDPTKKRMYPKDKVYPGNGEEFSLEEILAEEYERKYKEEEAKEKALAEARREEEARRAREELNEMRKIEAEKFNTINEMNPPLQAAIPVVTPKMLNIKPMDNSLANSTTFTVHTKEAMNVVQDMWSSPAPSVVPPRSLFKAENPPSQFPPQNAKSLKFEIYTEDNIEQKTPKQPFQIYNENADQVPRTALSSKSKLPFEIYDENAPPNKEVCVPPNQLSAFKNKPPFDIYDENQPMKDSDDIANAQKPIAQQMNKLKIFEDIGASEFPEKLDTQARLQPFLNVQDKNDDFSDVTCNTKAFEFVLPSSTPLATHKKPLLSAQKFESSSAFNQVENTRLSVILENSKDKSQNSSTSSVVSVCSRSQKALPVLQSDMLLTDECNAPSIPIVPRQSHYRHSSFYHASILNTIEEESHSQISVSNSTTNALEMSLSPCTNLTYLVKEKNLNKPYSLDINLNESSDSSIGSKPFFNEPLVKLGQRNTRITKSFKISVDKENLSPGMLGFPGAYIKKPNSALLLRSSQKSQTTNFIDDKENISMTVLNKEPEVSPHKLISKNLNLDYNLYQDTKQYEIHTILENMTSVSHIEKKGLHKSSPRKMSLRSNKVKILPEVDVGNIRNSHVQPDHSPNINISEKTLTIERHSTSIPHLKKNIPKTSSLSKMSPRSAKKILLKVEVGEKTLKEIDVSIKEGEKLSPDELVHVAHSPSSEVTFDKERCTTSKNVVKTSLSPMLGNSRFHINCIPNSDGNGSKYGLKQTVTNCNNEKSLSKRKRGRPPKTSSTYQSANSMNIVTEAINCRSLRNKKSSLVSIKYDSIKEKNIVPESDKFERIKNKNESNEICPSKTLVRKKSRKKAQNSVPENFDPFNTTVIEELLNKIGFPKENHLSNYQVKSTSLPTSTKSIKLGDEVYSLLGEIGKGAYAKVVKANVRSSTVALKIEKPACKWEYYIAKELQSRVPPKFAKLFMDINAAFIYNNGSILETQYAKYGTLISQIYLNKEKTGKSLDLGVVLHYCIELIDIVEYLHKAKIIHADLKPDNIVIRELPSHNEPEPCIQLIDFGRCIDMNLLPPDIEFNHVFKTEDNKCIEMKENKPWSYQIDLQGLASIFYCLLASEYMKVVKKNDRWTLQKALSRLVKRELWNPIFDSLLNVNPSTDLPFNFSTMRQSLVETFEGSLNNYLQHINMFKNMIAGK